MATEAFLWAYENGEPATLRFSEVLKAFGDSVAGWDPRYGRLRLEFTSPADGCEVFCDPDSAETDRVGGLMISRPIRHPGLWQAVLRILSEHHAVLFFADETTPRFWNVESAKHFPDDLIAGLGTPQRVRTPEDIIASLEEGPK